MRLVLASLVLLFTSAAVGNDEHTWWCTATGITLTYEKEAVWGSDQATLTEARAEALSRCRADLSQCRIDECFNRAESSEKFEL